MKLDYWRWLGRVVVAVLLLVLIRWFVSVPAATREVPADGGGGGGGNLTAALVSKGASGIVPGAVRGAAGRGR